MPTATKEKTTTKKIKSTSKKVAQTTNDFSNRTKGVSKDELNRLLAKGVSTKVKQSVLAEFLQKLSKVTDKEAAEWSLENIIQKTYLYSKFKLIKGNRITKNSKVTRLINSINGGLNLLPFCPVLVNEKFEICDGQHRFETAKKNGEPIYYIVCDSMTIKQIAEMNSNSNSWTLKDYLNCYVQLKNAYYIYFERFMNRHKIGVSTVSALLSGSALCAGGQGNIGKQEFCNGEMTIKDKDKKYANKVMGYVNDLKEFDDKGKFTNSRDFIMSVANLASFEEDDNIKYNHSRMISKMGEIPLKNFTMQPDVKEYLRMFEGIYNYGKTQKHYTRFF